jgi:hypothetical protein
MKGEKNEYERDILDLNEKNYEESDEDNQEESDKQRQQEEDDACVYDYIEHLEKVKMYMIEYSQSQCINVCDNITTKILHDLVMHVKKGKS